MAVRLLLGLAVVNLLVLLTDLLYNILGGLVPLAR